MGFAFKRGICAAVFGVAGLVSTAQAGPYSDLVIFGDSISDTGNVLALTQAFGAPNFPTFPGAEGRFSNGPVWTDALAAGLGLPNGAKSANLVFDGALVLPIGPLGGSNYAYGGAKTTFDGNAANGTGLLGQLVNWNGGLQGLFGAPGNARAADPDALYVVFAGANDLRASRTANPTDSQTDADARSAVAQSTATNLGNIVSLLASFGARHFLMSNLPDLGKTPEAVNNNVVAASTDITLKFNAALAATELFVDGFFLQNLGIDLDIRSMDLYSFSNQVFDDAQNNNGATFAITNVTSPCIEPGIFSNQYFAPDATDTNNNCGVSLFSDDLHPSARAHQLIGAMALNLVPEPGTLALLGVALAAMGFSRRNHKAVAAA